MRCVFKTLFILSLCFAVSLAEEHSDVVELTTEMWDETIKNNDAVFVEFYSDECPACRKFAPVWESFAAKLKTEIPNVVIAKLEGNKNIDTIHLYGITHTPTLYYFAKDPKAPINYNGARSLESLMFFIKTEMGFEDCGSPATLLDNVNDSMKWVFWRGTPDSTIAPSLTGFFPNKKSEEYKIYIQYAADMGDFRVAECFDTSIMELFDMPTDKPSILFSRENDEHLSIFTADTWTREAINEFLQPLLAPTVVRATHDTLKKYFRPDGKYVQVMVPPNMVKKTWENTRLPIFENAMLPLIHDNVIKRGEFTVIVSDGVEYKNWLAKNNLNPNKIPQMFLVTSQSKETFYWPGDMTTEEDIAVAVKQFITDYTLGFAYPIPTEPYVDPETETETETNENTDAETNIEHTEL